LNYLKVLQEKNGRVMVLGEMPDGLFTDFGLE